MGTRTRSFTTSIFLDDQQDNTPTEIRLVTDSDFPDGWCAVEFLRDSEIVAMPIRFKMASGGGRVAADFPACNPNFVITDSNGSITNG